VNHPIEWLNGTGRLTRHRMAPKLGEHTSEVLEE
jgi:hypothetical protein